MLYDVCGIFVENVLNVVGIQNGNFGYGFYVHINEWMACIRTLYRIDSSIF